jgi:hypothetical protein
MQPEPVGQALPLETTSPPHALEQYPSGIETELRHSPSLQSAAFPQAEPTGRPAEGCMPTTQRLLTQRAGGAQGGLQPNVGGGATQAPFEQVIPGAQAGVQPEDTGPTPPSGCPGAAKSPHIPGDSAVRNAQTRPGSHAPPLVHVHPSVPTRHPAVEVGQADAPTAETTSRMSTAKRERAARALTTWSREHR